MVTLQLPAFCKEDDTQAKPVKSSRLPHFVKELKTFFIKDGKIVNGKAVRKF